MDIGFGDIVVPEPQELDYPLLLDDMPEVSINAYSLETVVAEKFQTMIDRALANSRMKDFYDVYSILSSESARVKVNEETLSEAIALFSAIEERHILRITLFSMANSRMILSSRLNGTHS